MTTKPKLMTADELLAMPRGDGKKYELIRGVLVEKMPTGRPHAVVVTLIAIVLGSFILSRNLGEVHTGDPGYLLEVGPDTVRAPDIAWIAPGRIPEDATGYTNLAPDLAVEVKSSSNSNPELRRKAEMWLSFGVRQVWGWPTRSILPLPGTLPARNRSFWRRMTPLTAATCSPALPRRFGACSAGRSKAGTD